MTNPKFKVGDRVLIYDRYRFGGNGLLGTILEIQNRDKTEPEALVKLNEPIKISWPPLYDDRGYRKNWYCFNQLFPVPKEPFRWEGKVTWRRCSHGNLTPDYRRIESLPAELKGKTTTLTIVEDTE